MEVIMEKSYILKRHILILFIILVSSFAIGMGRYPCKAYAENINEVSPKYIGQVHNQEENGLAVSGVSISLNDFETNYYAFDVWKYSKNGGWNFWYENLQGITSTEQREMIRDIRFPVSFFDKGDPRGHIWIKGSILYDDHCKNFPCYSIETTRYQQGKMISREYEYSTDSRSKWLDSQYSLMTAFKERWTLRLGTGSPDQISYIYRIHNGIFIGKSGSNGAVDVETNGGTVLQAGEAYYDVGDGFVVRKLPEIVRERDRNVYVLEGWYTAQNGGTKVSVGDYVTRGGKIYARWKAVPQKCDVTCVDILQTRNTEQILGCSGYEGEFGETVTGEIAGCSTQSGIYYPGRDYIGCSKTIVKAEGTKVYRYFKNSLKTVRCLDIVNEGPDTGQQLGNHIWNEQYTSITSGGAIGDNRQVGRYYDGYEFTYSTSCQVGLDGCTVYRYFSPIKYNIEFMANCESGGKMSMLQNLYYGHDYQLTRNAFINRKKILFDPNAEDVMCDTIFQMVYLEFMGWSDSQDGGVLYSDGSTVNGLKKEGGTIRLFAVWSTKEIMLSAQPKRMGYEFAGWSENAAASAGERQFKIDRDITLHAIWQAAPIKYHVEYYKQKLDHSYELAVQYDFSGKTGTMASVGDIRDLYPGFVLDEESSKMTGEVKADGSLVLNAYFRRGEYSVRFDLNGGQLISGSDKPIEIKGLFEEKLMLPEVTMTRTGYSFAGWSIGRESDVVVAHPGENYAVPNHNQTLYARWIPNTDTAYYIIPYYENLNGTGYMKGEKNVFYGTTGSKAAEELLKHYSVDTIEKCIKKIYGEGYELSDAKSLEETMITADGNTCIEINLNRKMCDILFFVEKDQGQQIITSQQVKYGQQYTMPEKLKNIDQIGCYIDENDQTLYPGDIVMVSKNKRFKIVQKGLLSPDFPKTSAEAPETTMKPEKTPSVVNTTTPVSYPPAQTMMPGPIYSMKPVDTPQPIVTQQAAKNTKEPAGKGKVSPQPSTSPTDGMSVVSTWVGNDSNKIAQKIAEHAGASFVKKGKKIKKDGIVYKVIESSITKRSLCVTGITKDKKVVKIPAQLQIKGYGYKVKKIEKKALSGKKNLQKIIVGKNIQEIGKKAFSNNKGLKKILFQTTKKPKVAAGAWKGCNRSLKLIFDKKCGMMVRKHILKQDRLMK